MKIRTGLAALVVAFCLSCGGGSSSNPASPNANAPVPPIPSAPINVHLTVSSTSPDSLELTWNSPTDSSWTPRIKWIDVDSGNLQVTAGTFISGSSARSFLTNFPELHNIEAEVAFSSSGGQSTWTPSNFLRTSLLRPTGMQLSIAHNLTTGRDDIQIKATVNPVSIAQYIKIERRLSTASPDDWMMISVQGIDSIKQAIVLDSNCLELSTYQYRCSAVTGSDESSYFTPVPNSNLDYQDTSLGWATNLSISQNPNSMLVSWEDSSLRTSSMALVRTDYPLRGTPASGTKLLASLPFSSSASYSDTPASTGFYSYFVHSVGDDGIHSRDSQFLPFLYTGPEAGPIPNQVRTLQSNEYQPIGITNDGTEIQGFYSQSGINIHAVDNRFPDHLVPNGSGFVLPGLLIDSNNHIYILSWQTLTYDGYTSRIHIIVSSWDGTGWDDIDLGALQGSPAGEDDPTYYSSPSSMFLGLDNQGVPCFEWTEDESQGSTPSFTIHLWRYTGGTWKEGVSHNFSFPIYGGAQPLGVRFDPQGNLVAGFVNAKYVFSLFTSVDGGSSWTDSDWDLSLALAPQSNVSFLTFHSMIITGSGSGDIIGSELILNPSYVVDSIVDDFTVKLTFAVHFNQDGSFQIAPIATSHYDGHIPSPTLFLNPQNSQPAAVIDLTIGLMLAQRANDGTWKISPISPSQWLMPNALPFCPYQVSSSGDGVWVHVPSFLPGLDGNSSAREILVPCLTP